MERFGRPAPPSPALAALIALPLLLCGLVGAAPPRPKAKKPAAAPAALASLAVRDLGGGSHALLPAPRGTKATVLLFLSTDCPVSNRYTPRLVKWAQGVAGRPVRVLGVYSNAREDSARVVAEGRERALPFPLVRDEGGRLAKRIGATLTPEAVVLDGKGAVRYRGRIDDSDDPAKVSRRDLADAVNALLAGKPVRAARTRAFGCVIQGTATPEPVASTSDAPKPTYWRDVAPILRRRCVECHADGEVAPFALADYAQAAQWAKQIKVETQKRAMPPWKAESSGEFLHERRMSDGEISTLAAWVDAGAPEGQRPAGGVAADDAPARPAHEGGWRLAKPDAVLDMPVTYTVPADGKDIYRCFVLPTDFEDDRWVSSVEFQPGNRAAVHHINLWIDTSGKARKLDKADPEPGYTSPAPGSAPGIVPFGVLGGWLPGHVPWRLPEGVGILLPRGADIVFEVHYVTTGKPEQDRSRFGLTFVPGVVKKRLQLGEVSQNRLTIPAGAKAHQVTASETAPQDVTLLSVTPHMHLLGRTMTLTATLPDGTKRRLVHVPDWDFNWQLSYRFKEPVRLPRGTRLDLVATYDNTAENPNNPHKPPRDVYAGESTADEMCNIFLAYTLDYQDLSTEGVVVD